MEEIKNIISTFFDGVWSLFTGFQVPLFDVPLSTIVIGFVMIKLSLTMIGVVTGFRSGVASASEGFRSSAVKLGAYRKAQQSKLNRGNMSE